MGKNRDHSKFPNAITVLDNGNVGIGNISPGYKLDVTSSNSSAIFSATSTYTWTGGYLDHSSFLAPNITGGAVSVTIGKSASTYNVGKIVFNYAGSGSSSNSIGLGFYDADNKLVVRADGNVGMGTTSPSTKLHLYNGGNPLSIQIQRTSVPVYLSDVQIAGTTAGAVWSHNLENTSNGSLTWGGFANTNYSGSAIMLNSSTSSSWVSIFTANSANTTPTEAIRVLGNGYIGIGTTSPEGPLHIKGAISAGYVGMAIVNYVSTANTSAGIDFGVDASGVYNGGGNAQIKVTNSNGSDNRSKMDLNIWNGSALVTGINISDTGKVSFPATTAMNYAVSSATAVTVTNNCSPTTVASVTLTTSGKPVLITVSGDNNPLGGPTWCYVMIFRNGSAVGHRVIAESPGNSVNTPFALTHIDTPSAGSNTYTVNVSVCGSYPIIFGETGDVQAPTITVVELL